MFVGEGMDRNERLAKVEAIRQRKMEHYNLSQRPIYRTIYPEYVLDPLVLLSLFVVLFCCPVSFPCSVVEMIPVGC
jgi:hypothetical protein